MPRRAPTDIKSLARSYTKVAVDTLRGFMCNEETPASVRVDCAKYLLDRGWGRAAQAIEVTGQVTNKVIRAPELSDTNEEWVNTHVPQHLRVEH